jgi:hypothetical protein
MRTQPSQDANQLIHGGPRGHAEMSELIVCTLWQEAD